MQFRKSVKKESKLCPRIASRPQYFLWLGPPVLGNITGGVLPVTLLEYGQVNLE
jgi:hypothetical protein